MIFYLFALLNSVLLVRTFFSEKIYKNYEKINWAIMRYNNRDVNSRYVSKRLSEVFFERSSEFIKDQVFTLLLLLLLILETIYVFFFVISAASLAHVPYIVSCIALLLNKDRVSVDRLILFLKIISITIIIN
jgi:hypothetical protein